MRVVKNEKLIQSRGRLARWLMPLGLVALVLGFFLSLQMSNPQSQMLSWVALIIGVFASTIGVNLADKWMELPQRPRADKTLENALRALDVRHKLYSWALPPAEQALLSPAGVTVLLVKKQEGEISCQDGKWRNKIGLRLFLSSISRERLGNPTKDLNTAMDNVRKLLATNVPDVEVPVTGLVVLSSPEAKLNIAGCIDMAATPADLRDKLRNVTASERRLTDAEYRRVEEVLDGQMFPDAVEISPAQSGVTRPGTTPVKTSPRLRSARSRFGRPTKQKPPKTTPKR